MRKIRLADGSEWPFPDLSVDDVTSPEWKAVHMPKELTPDDLAYLAAVSAAYRRAVMTPSVVKQLRRLRVVLRVSSPTHPLRVPD